MVLVGVVGELGCHSEDTLVWTPDGFRYFQDVEVGDDVWGCDGSLNLQKVKVLAKYEYDYDGEMVLVSNLNLFVTPNHKVLVKGRLEQDFKYYDAIDLLRDSFSFPIKSDWFNQDERVCLVEPKSVSLVPYRGKVWCFTTDSGNFFTSRGGKVCLSGNSGKTLSLTYLAFRNYLNGVKIYANYHLNFPFTYVTTIEQIDEMKEGFFAGDELWLWIDSRASQSRKNKIISSILLKSRKRNVNFSYTTQSFMQVDKRIRNVTDFVATPMLSPDERWCRIMFFSYPSYSKARIVKFRTAPVFELYDTREEIAPLQDTEEEKKPTKKEQTIRELREEIKRLKERLKSDKKAKAQV